MKKNTILKFFKDSSDKCINLVIPICVKEEYLSVGMICFRNNFVTSILFLGENILHKLMGLVSIFELSS